MAEYIDREALIEFIKQNTPNINGETTIECVERAIRTHPAADVVEVVHGEWIYKGIADMCSICGRWLVIEQASADLNYCPNCGAKMDGKRKDSEENGL